MEQTNRRRGQKQKPQKKKKKINKKVIILSIVAVFALLFAYLFATQVVKPTIAANNPLSILIVGTDVDAHRDVTYAGTKPEKTDALMVVTFNPDTYKVVATSIPRDTAVDYICPETGEMRGKINEVYPASGNNMDCLVDTVSNFLNIPIDYYVKFNLDQAAAIIDQVGGITITAHAADGTLCQESTDGENSYCWVDGETYTMDGTEAICYARARHDSEKDYGRGIRQQQVVKATFTAIAQTGFDIELIKSLFALVETNMEPKLLYDYYNYFMAINQVLGMYNGEVEIDESAVPKSVWEALFEAADYKEMTVSNENIAAYFEFIKANNVDLSDYFIDNYQFVNDTYNGFYVTVDEQRYEISNALRENLGLRTEDPPAYQYEFGYNSFDEKHASSGGGTSNEDPVEETPVDTDGDGYIDEIDSCPEEAPVVDDGAGCEEIVEDPDTDGDGILDSADICPGEDDAIDNDFDGIADCVDDVIDGDADGDGVLDSADLCEGTDDTIDMDEDGFADCADDIIDSDADTVADTDDMCPGEDDTIDIDVDGIPDCADDEVIDGETPPAQV